MSGGKMQNPVQVYSLIPLPRDRPVFIKYHEKTTRHALKVIRLKIQTYWFESFCFYFYDQVDTYKYIIFFDHIWEEPIE